MKTRGSKAGHIFQSGLFAMTKITSPGQAEFLSQPVPVPSLGTLGPPRPPAWSGSQSGSHSPAAFIHSNIPQEHGLYQDLY